MRAWPPRRSRRYAKPGDQDLARRPHSGGGTGLHSDGGRISGPMDMARGSPRRPHSVGGTGRGRSGSDTVEKEHWRAECGSCGLERTQQGAPPSRQSAPGLAPPSRTQPGPTHPVTVASPRHRVHSRESCGPRSRQAVREGAQSKKFWISFGNFCHYFLFQKKSAEKKIMFFRPPPLSSATG